MADTAREQRQGRCQGGARSRAADIGQGEAASTAAATIVIPTFGREEVLIETIEAVLHIAPPGIEFLVMDQTPTHSRTVSDALLAWVRGGHLRLCQLDQPNIPRAMNAALEEACNEIVLYLDDDIIPVSGLIEAHLAAHCDTDAAVIAGRVIQPWHDGVEFSNNNHLQFVSARPAWLGEFMGGNFSVRREIALGIGGFDENFVRVAYNFEAEFAHRLRQAGHKIFYEPKACIHHLKVSSGGTRTFGEHLATAKPDHAVGAYYYMVRTWRGWPSLRSLMWRPVRSIATRYHLRRPWRIPFTLIAELRGMIWALALARRGPKFVGPPSRRAHPA